MNRTLHLLIFCFTVLSHTSTYAQECESIWIRGEAHNTSHILHTCEFEIIELPVGHIPAHTEKNRLFTAGDENLVRRPDHSTYLMDRDGNLIKEGTLRLSSSPELQGHYFKLSSYVQKERSSIFRLYDHTGEELGTQHSYLRLFPLENGSIGYRTIEGEAGIMDEYGTTTADLTQHLLPRATIHISQAGDFGYLITNTQCSDRGLTCTRIPKLIDHEAQVTLDFDTLFQEGSILSVGVFRYGLVPVYVNSASSLTDQDVRDIHFVNREGQTELTISNVNDVKYGQNDQWIINRHGDHQKGETIILSLRDLQMQSLPEELTHSTVMDCSKDYIVLQTVDENNGWQLSLRSRSDFSTLSEYSSSSYARITLLNNEYHMLSQGLKNNVRSIIRNKDQEVMNLLD